MVIMVRMTAWLSDPAQLTKKPPGRRCTLGNIVSRHTGIGEPQAEQIARCIRSPFQAPSYALQLQTSTSSPVIQDHLAA